MGPAFLTLDSSLVRLKSRLFARRSCREVVAIKLTAPSFRVPVRRKQSSQFKIASGGVT